MINLRLNAAYYDSPVEEVLSASDNDVYPPLTSPRGYMLAPQFGAASSTCPYPFREETNHAPS